MEHCTTLINIAVSTASKLPENFLGKPLLVHNDLMRTTIKKVSNFTVNRDHRKKGWSLTHGEIEVGIYVIPDMNRIKCPLEYLKVGMSKPQKFLEIFSRKLHSKSGTIVMRFVE